MKNSLFVKITLVLVVAMILGQIFGSLAIRYFFLRSKIDELSPVLSEISTNIAEGNNLLRRHDFIVKAYDLYGKELTAHGKNSQHSLSFNDEELFAGLSPYLPKLLAGQNVADIKDIQGLPGTTIVIGRQIVKDGQVIGTVFLMKPASDYKVVLNGFYLVFFSVSLLSSIIILTILGLYLKAHSRLEQTRRDYVANISHELRTPISSIKALTETLCDGMVVNEYDKVRYYHIIHGESVRLERLISDMLQLSRLQSNMVALERASFSGADMMEEVISKYEVLADDMDITLRISENAKKLPILFSNRDRIIQVLNILLDNALKFCGSEGTVEVDAHTMGRKIHISVKNGGEAIEKEDIPFIFDRFYQSEKSHSKSGSGLGLSIAREILQNLGETITVESGNGKMTTFTFTVKIS